MDIQMFCCVCVSGEPVPRSLEGLFVYEERSTSPPANDTIVVEQWTVIEVSEDCVCLSVHVTWWWMASFTWKQLDVWWWSVVNEIKCQCRRGERLPSLIFFFLSIYCLYQRSAWVTTHLCMTWFSTLKWRKPTYWSFVQTISLSSLEEHCLVYRCLSSVCVCVCRALMWKRTTGPSFTLWQSLVGCLPACSPHPSSDMTGKQVTDTQYTLACMRTYTSAYTRL